MSESRGRSSYQRNNNNNQGYSYERGVERMEGVSSTIAPPPPLPREIEVLRNDRPQQNNYQSRGRSNDRYHPYSYSNRRERSRSRSCDRCDDWRGGYSKDYDHDRHRRDDRGRDDDHRRFSNYPREDNHHHENRYRRHDDSYQRRNDRHFTERRPNHSKKGEERIRGREEEEKFKVYLDGISGYNIEKSSRKDDMEHIDFWVTENKISSSGLLLEESERYGVDVKAPKKINRRDDLPQFEFFWAELFNSNDELRFHLSERTAKLKNLQSIYKSGDAVDLETVLNNKKDVPSGWLFSARTKYIAFRDDAGTFKRVSRAKLAELVMTKLVVDHTVVRSDDAVREPLFGRYVRFDKNRFPTSPFRGEIVAVPFDQVLAISENW